MVLILGSAGLARPVVAHAGVGGALLGQLVGHLAGLALALAAVDLRGALVDGPPGGHVLVEDVDVVVERVEVGEGGVVGELDRLVDGRDGLLVELLEVFLGDHALVDQAVGERLDRVALTPLLDLFLGAVLLRVGHRVAAVAVGHRLDQLRTAVLARAAKGLGHDAVDVERVHAVAAGAGHAVALGLQRQVGDRRVAVKRGAHAELVVDDHEDHRQLPERGEVHGLAEGALVGGAVAHHGQDRVVGLHVVAGERHAGAQRQRAADDAVAAEKALVPVEQVHGAAAAGGAAVDAAEELGHHGLGVGAARERLAVLAVGRHEVVGLAQRLGGADDGGLLTDAQVQEAADLGLGVHLARALLEAADEHHLPQDGGAGLLVGQVVLDLAELDLLGRLYLAGRDTVTVLLGRALVGRFRLPRSHPGRTVPGGPRRLPAKPPGGGCARTWVEPVSRREQRRRPRGDHRPRRPRRRRRRSARPSPRARMPPRWRP